MSFSQGLADREELAIPVPRQKSFDLPTDMPVHVGRGALRSVSLDRLQAMLNECLDRTFDFWSGQIVPALSDLRNVLSLDVVSRRCPELRFVDRRVSDAPCLIVCSCGHGHASQTSHFSRIARG